MKNNTFKIFTLFVVASIVFACQNKPAEVKVTAENALQSYLNNGDKSFKWDVQDSIKTEGSSLYRLQLTSQTWRDTVWNHEMTVIIPDEVKYNDGLLFITGGSLKKGKPNIHKWTEDLIVSLEQLAKVNKSIVSIIWQIPNEPLFNGLSEDEIISYTLHSFTNDSDYTWPLLFPMTKSAIRAMDAVQEFTAKKNSKVNQFVVTGASKRGWTTWLTGANDSRVKAIGPMVIDMLRWPDNIEYHKTTWGDYSIQIEDYVKLGITGKMDTKAGKEIIKMVDPYSYRKLLTMPKMLFMGTNDEYWPVDAVKNYFDSIPGQNYICYTPNAGHDLGGGKTAFPALSAFFGTTITNGIYPKCNYTFSEENGKFTVKMNASADLLEDAYVWSSVSTDREFRDKTWSGASLGKSGVSEFTYEVPFPQSGFMAFYIDLKYKAPFQGDYTQSSRMFLLGTNGLLKVNK